VKRIATRLLSFITVVWAVLTIFFIMFKLLPGDPTAVFLDSNLSPELIARQKELWGLSDPMWLQYIRYIRNMASFHFGVSFFQQQPVADILWERVKNTCLMIVPALLISIVGGTLIGAAAGWRRGSRFERFTVGLSLLLHSAPSFVVGILALMVFAYRLRWLPSGGIVSLGAPDGFWQIVSSGDYVRHAMLPVMVLVSREITGPILLLRGSMFDIKSSDFIEILRAKGISETRVLVHATRNALLPLATYIAVMIGVAFQGQVLLEIIFAWPGVGRELVTALADLDYPIAQACLYLMALVILTMNFIVDALYGVIDPRISNQHD
jgi:peptide/nickel transport system permease protein